MVVPIDENAIIFDLIVKSDITAKISSLLSVNNDITKSLAYDIEMREKQIHFEYRSENSDERSYVTQNHPNPFKDETIIKVSQKLSAPITISIYDSRGVSVSNNTISLPTGHHNININASQLNSSFGIFFVKIKSKELNEVIKILRIE